MQQTTTKSMWWKGCFVQLGSQQQLTKCPSLNIPRTFAVGGATLHMQIPTPVAFDTFECEYPSSLSASSHNEPLPREAFCAFPPHKAQCDVKSLTPTLLACMLVAQIWDTAGQERFRSITRAYYRDSDGTLQAKTTLYLPCIVFVVVF